MNKVSVVIPTYNEELALESNVRELVHVLDTLHREWELVLINDGSTDATLSIMEKMSRENLRIRIVSYIPNRGRGFALKMGFKSAAGDYIIATESDLNWGAEIIKRFVIELDKGDADIIVASPHMKGGKMENVPFARWFLSFMGNKLFSRTVPGKLTMITGMTRGYRREVLDSLELESNDKDLHVEIISKAIDLGFRVREIPATLRWKKAQPGAPVRKSHFKFKSIFKHLLLTFEVRPYLLFGGLGAILLIAGAVLSIYLISLSSESGVAGRPLLFATMLIILLGFLSLIFGFLATQNREIERQLTRIQKSLKDVVRK